MTKPNRLASAMLGCLLSVLLCVPLLHSHAQSGRNKQDEKRPVKPVPLPPLPKPPVTAPEQKEEAIRINTDLVTVVTNIIAPAGGKASDLQREDFEVLEDGAAQELTIFTRESEAPLRLVMLFDTSLSVAPRLAFEKKAAAKFFERLIRPQDQAALFSVATDVVLQQEFTNRVPLLTNATKQLKAGGATSLYDGIYLAADYLKPARGRRIIVLITDGGDTTSAKTLKLALQQTQGVDGVIYAIYTGGLWNSQNLRDLAAERALAALTKETGGEVYHPKLADNDDAAPDDNSDHALKELDAAFAKLADELRTQYILGFYSSNEARDGGFRKLAVKIKKPGFSARARAGYYAPKG
ncbi:MAG: VWA domain-containing protein [Acidobacteria bacterium]|nr:VWA domain-containing protein [Acidobacteriota bacterium]